MEDRVSRGPDESRDEPAEPGGRPHGSDEEIDEASDESFPASDAPQWWSGGPDENP
ncbi:MAG TPA: hypothetical protein VKU86_10600 [Acidimicrobiales bacterium]|nr:hypothetical protein [Acidimicrobiales bacterium]